MALVLSNASAKAVGRRSNRRTVALVESKAPLRANQVPVWNPQIRMSSLRLRFTCQSSGIFTITAKYILDLMFIATSSSAGYCLWDAFRVRFVEIRYGGTSPVPLYAAIQYVGNSGGTQGDYRNHSATSMGVTPMLIHAAPAKNSTASTWQGNTNSVVMELDLPQSAIVDLVFDVRTDDRQTPTAVTYAVVGATAGQLYYRGLDGVAGPASNLAPFGPVLSG